MSAHACHEVRAEKPTIQRFICQPVYRRQSQVDHRRSIWVLFEGNPVSCDHRPVEGESRQRSAAWRGSRHQGIECVRYFAYAKFVIFEGRWRDSKRLQRLWSAVSLAGFDLRAD